MTCWKCGSETGGDAECKACARSTVQSDTPMVQLIIQMVPIDWSKAQSIDDIKLILQNSGFCIERGSPVHQKLKRFVKE